MLVGETHTSHSDPPTNTMFVRAGLETVKRRSPSSSDVVIQVVDKLATVLSPKASSPRNSPARIIDGRSKCYKQLHELKNLNTLGVRVFV